MIISTIADTSDENAYVSSLVSIITDDEAGTSTLEISGVDELSFDVISTASIVEVDGVEYTVTSVVDPEAKLDQVEFVTSKVLTNNININGNLTQSININFLL